MVSGNIKNKMKENIRKLKKYLKENFKEESFSFSLSKLKEVSCDESGFEPVLPVAVVYVEKEEDVMRLLKIAKELKIPVTARGGGTSLEGSSIPCRNGIVVDLRKMDKIIEFKPHNFYVRVEPGLIYAKLNEKIKSAGLFFPPHPGGSSKTATIGGMVATNASGIYTMRYGGVRDYVTGLRIISGDGKIIETGSVLRKHSSGFDITHLMVGSEGTLGIFTEIILRLQPLAESYQNMMLCFYSYDKLLSFALDIFSYIPEASAIEFIDTETIRAIKEFGGFDIPLNPIIILELHGSKEDVMEKKNLLIKISEDYGGGIIETKENPWEIREMATNAVKFFNKDKKLKRVDVAIPPDCTKDFFEKFSFVARELRIKPYIFGHFGITILHILIPSKENDNDNAIKLKDFAIEKALSYGGAISGEHGIGLGNIEYLKKYIKTLPIMKKIKKIFDPYNILNRGKIFL